MSKRIQDIQGILQLLLRQVIQPGDSVLDATAGRGRDTLFLAQCVGESGKVYALDIQHEAIEATQSLLAAKGLSERAELHVMDHARLGDIVQGELRAAMFNLGYLPGSDHRIVTEADTTFTALAAAAKRLARGGIMSITVYRGHPGAEQEAAAVEKFIRCLPEDYAVLEGRYPTLSQQTPYWFLIQKKGM